MKPLLLLALLVIPPCFSQELSEPKKKLLEAAEKSGVEVRFDQPYAGNRNPKQMVDVYLPKKTRWRQAAPCHRLHSWRWLGQCDRLGYASEAINIARHGHYAVVAVGYRLTNEAHWPEQIYDCKAAIRWIRGHARELNLDADHIGVKGSSAGGHLCSLLGTSGDVKEIEGGLGSFTTLSSRVTCVVNQCGPEDFTKALMFDKDKQPIIKDPAVMGLLGGTYEEKHAEAVAASPLTYVTRDDPPFLTIHGTADKRVDFANAGAIHAALQKAGVPSLLIPITGGGHGSVYHPETDKRSQQFLDKYLLGVPAEIDVTAVTALPEVKKEAKKVETK